ncbi:MAG: YihA family ribosome biogenesis GTP-binding protein [Clostridia bacterium]|jgi:GTP-binding protein|nr:YihA family ribosome biogenesis GTP-binding protein [Clostridia bacterium]
MKIITAEYLVSAVNAKQYPKSSKPEIALVGRSNVGKSSFINKFINRKGLARTSSVPGKTQTINFYLINEAWCFVDLPGYGFAKVSKEKKSVWGRFIDEYLHTRPHLAGIMQLVDIRHEPTADDVLMHEWLAQSGLPYLVIATKADKIPRSKWDKQKKIIKEKLALCSAESIMIFSAQTGEGRDKIASWVEELIKPVESL